MSTLAWAVLSFAAGLACAWYGPRVLAAWERRKARISAEKWAREHPHPKPFKFVVDTTQFDEQMRQVAKVMRDASANLAATRRQYRKSDTPPEETQP